MAVLNFSDALTEARRKSQLSGRPLSQQEMADITEAYSKTAGERAMQQKQIELSERSQKAQEEQFAKTLEMNQMQMEMQGEQFEKNLGLQIESNRERSAEFTKTMDFEYEKNRQMMQAAEAARRSQETAGYISAGVSMASMIIMALILAPKGPAPSDKKLKTNIRTITEEMDPMALLENNAIRGIFYQWKDKSMGNGTEIGFTAQMFEHIPGLTVEIDGILHLRYDRITAILWEQNRELLRMVKELKEKINV